MTNIYNVTLAILPDAHGIHGGSGINAAYAMTYTEQPNEILENRHLAKILENRHLARLDAQKEWHKRLPDELKRLKIGKKDKIPKGALDSLRNDIFKKYNIEEYEKQLSDSQKAREQLLDDLAPKVEIIPDPECWYCVRNSSSYAYSTQTQPAFYAEGALRPWKLKLEQAGLETHVRKTHQKFSSLSQDFELWTNAPTWMTDAVFRQMTQKEWIAAYKGTPINPYVFNPFLHYGVWP